MSRADFVRNYLTIQRRPSKSSAPSPGGKCIRPAYPADELIDLLVRALLIPAEQLATQPDTVENNGQLSSKRDTRFSGP